MSATLTVGQIASVIDALRAKNDAKTRATGRDLVRHLRRSYPGRSFSPATTASIRLFEEKARAFENLDQVEGERRRLERELESAKADVRRLRRARLTPIVAAAVRRGVVAEGDREGTLRRLEAGDEQLAARLDPNYRPSEQAVQRELAEFAHGLGVAPEALL